MLNTLLRELARSWNARAEEMAGPEDGSDTPEAHYARGIKQGQIEQLEKCADDLEKLLSLYGPLLRD